VPSHDRFQSDSGKRAQHLVPRDVAVLVVDALEVIDVEQRDAE
jgi:hypothetical protein